MVLLSKMCVRRLGGLWLSAGPSLVGLMPRFELALLTRGSQTAIEGLLPSRDRLSAGLRVCCIFRACLPWLVQKRLNMLSGSACLQEECDMSRAQIFPLGGA